MNSLQMEGPHLFIPRILCEYCNVFRTVRPGAEERTQANVSPTSEAVFAIHGRNE